MNLRNENTGSALTFLGTLDNIKKHQSLGVFFTNQVKDVNTLTYGVENFTVKNAIDGGVVQSKLGTVYNTDLLKTFPGSVEFLKRSFKYSIFDDDKKIEFLKSIKQSNFQQLSYEVVPRFIGMTGIVLFQLFEIVHGLPTIQALDSLMNQFLFFLNKNGGIKQVITSKSNVIPKPFSEDAEEFNEFVMERRMVGIQSNFAIRFFTHPFWVVSSLTQMKLKLLTEVEIFANAYNFVSNVFVWFYHNIWNFGLFNRDNLNISYAGYVDILGAMEIFDMCKSKILSFIYSKNTNPFGVDRH